MDKHGFVYIWRDRKYNRYYVGYHWGIENDKYICSSTWMRNSYNRRPEDFKRRILVNHIPTKAETIAEEHRWLQMMKKEELGNRYYNFRNCLFPIADLTTRRSYSGENNPMYGVHLEAWNKGKELTDEHKLHLSESHEGKTLSDEHKHNIGKSMEGREITWADKISAAQKGIPRQPHTEEWKKNMSKLKKGKAPNNKGKAWSPERRMKFDLMMEERNFNK